MCHSYQLQRNNTKKANNKEDTKKKPKQNYKQSEIGEHTWVCQILVYNRSPISFIIYLFFKPQHVWDLSSLTRCWIHIPFIGSSLNHWIAREVPLLFLYKYVMKKVNQVREIKLTQLETIFTV